MMSRSAVVFLLAALLSAAGALLTPAGPGSDMRVLLFAAACFSALFVASLIRGKRFRFDPLLR